MSHGTFTVSRAVHFGPTRRAAPDAPVVYLSEGEDKYAVEVEHAPIDCADRLAICHAACCRLRVPLTRQDVDEGVVRWDREQPYLNEQRPDGWCVHCATDDRRCAIYAQRPGLCRTFDCRDDARIWLDFDRRIPNPSLGRSAQP